MQLVEHFRQQLQVERIGAVGLGLRGIVVHFHEDAVHSGRDRGARQQRNEFGLAAALPTAVVAVRRRRPTAVAPNASRRRPPAQTRA